MVHDGPMSIRSALQVPPGPVDLTAHDPSAKPGFHGKKGDGRAALAAMEPEFKDLQEKLYANRDSGKRVLLVLQGMDTSGKGGVLDHTVGLMPPEGVKITSFKAPTDEEKKHDFLWRVRNAVAGPGYVTVFDRSHYEDVLIARVHQFAGPSEIERRYDAINDFEQELAQAGTAIVKCMLHVSAEEQKQRLLARLDDPTKHWKFNPADIDERAHWAQYRQAYEVALERCNTAHSPWFVIPSDRKWYRNYAIGILLRDALRGLDLGWPRGDFDVEVEKKRLSGEAPVA